MFGGIHVFDRTPSTTQPEIVEIVEIFCPKILSLQENTQSNSTIKTVKQKRSKMTVMPATLLKVDSTTGVFL